MLGKTIRISLAAGSTGVHTGSVEWFATDVTSPNDVLEFRLLGPLEVRVRDTPLTLGGAKQRAALALLLLHADEIVSVERLIDEIWREDPPPSAAHSLEAYVSRLRQLFEATGLRLLRRGTGYVLVLGEARLDAQTFAQLCEEASHAAAEGDDERASELATEALALWRGPPLADVRLGTWGSIEAERLEELRLLVFEQRADAELRLGRHEELVGELQALVRHNPHRERLVALLMLALYRSGRPADALETYAQTRMKLDDLGLQPSAELQQLSGRIVRHEPELRLAARSGPPAAPRPPARKLPSIAASFAAAALVLMASGSVRQAADAAPPREGVRVALVLPRPPVARPQNPIAGYAERLRDHLYFDTTLSTQTIIARDLANTAATLARGHFDLVLWVGDGPVSQGFAPRVRGLGGTRFVFLDASLETLGLRGVRNATAVRFAEEESSELVGYMSGLVAARGSTGPADVVSVIAPAEAPTVKRVVAGFRRGAARARPVATVIVDYVDRADRTRCEEVANAQIDRGSDVVFTVGGRCSVAAAAVARSRGVWSAADGGPVTDGSVDPGYGEHLLVQTYKHREQAIDNALAAFTNSTLPAGRDLVLGLVDDYAVGISGTNPNVALEVSSAVVRLCSTIRSHSQTDES